MKETCSDGSNFWSTGKKSWRCVNHHSTFYLRRSKWRCVLLFIFPQLVLVRLQKGTTDVDSHSIEGNYAFMDYSFRFHRRQSTIINHSLSKLIFFFKWWNIHQREGMWRSDIWSEQICSWEQVLMNQSGYLVVVVYLIL